MPGDNVGLYPLQRQLGCHDCEMCCSKEAFLKSLISFSGAVLWPRHICGPERKMSRAEMKELAITSLGI
jgi:hypothetical protein